MIDKYPNLLWSLSYNPDLQSMIFEKYRDNAHFLHSLENVILELRSYNCIGIQEKMTDIPDRNKLLSAISELETAQLLVNYVQHIELLPDDYLTGKSPDIFCKDKNICLYFEVTRLNDNPYVENLIFEFLRNFLKDVPYMVDSFLNENLSLPKVKGYDRRAQKAIVDSCLNEFKELFSKVECLESSFIIDTESIRFELTKINNDRGFPAIIMWECIEVPEDELLEYTKGRLIRKAEKRDSFEGEHRTYPYIIVFDCKESSIDDIYINRLLYGKTRLIGDFSDVHIKYSTWQDVNWEGEVSKVEQRPSWEKIEEAKNNGWEQLLINKFLLPNDYTYISEEGIFLTEAEMENVSAVLFRDNFGKVSFYPNPFCSYEINNVELQKQLNRFLDGIDSKKLK